MLAFDIVLKLVRLLLDLLVQVSNIVLHRLLLQDLVKGVSLDLLADQQLQIVFNSGQLEGNSVLKVINLILQLANNTIELNKSNLVLESMLNLLHFDPFLDLLDELVLHPASLEPDVLIDLVLQQLIEDPELLITDQIAFDLLFMVVNLDGHLHQYLFYSTVLLFQFVEAHRLLHCL